MSFKITGTVKFNQFSHEYALDLNVTEVQPEPRLTLREKLALKPEVKLFHQEVYDYEEAPAEPQPTTYTVEYQGSTSKQWEQSFNTGIDNPYTDFEAARYNLLAYRAKGLNYRIRTGAGICVYFDAVPEETPSTFVVEFESQPGGTYTWVRSTNPGLRDRTFATKALAEEAMEEFGSTKQLLYRVTEVLNAN